MLTWARLPLAPFYEVLMHPQAVETRRGAWFALEPGVWRVVLAFLVSAVGVGACSNRSNGGAAGSAGASGSAAAAAGSTASAGGGGANVAAGGNVAAGTSNAGGSASGVAGGGADNAGAAGAAGAAVAGGGSGGAHSVAWETRTLSTQHTAEGADVGDIDGDGKLDLVAGPNWYKGPDFALGGAVMASPPTFTMDQYSTFFLTFVDDVNGDGLADVIAIGDAGGANGSGTPNAFWYQNPGPSQLAQAWAKHAIYDELVSNESPVLANVVGDARPELVFMTDRQLGYAQPAATAAAAWTFTAVSGGSMFGTPYVHGLGAGDIDGDGVVDLVERSAWWRQTPGASWERRAFDFAMGADKTQYQNWGGAQMHVFDVDGDGDNDVVTGLAAHQYGLSWFEHQGTGAELTFVAHPILPASAGADNISQLHALAVADVNGDGLTDLVAGKRYYAHPASNPDPGTQDPPVLSWFELRRGGAGAEFVPHVIHEDSGAGCNFVARDVNGDGKVDVFTTNKRGTFLHLQR
jgi:hypothetical protein